MYQVIFAEDELLVRLGLLNSIPWERFYMDVPAQADNGVTAFELFKELRPDVVITDVRMEGMDGFELIRKIREIDKECAIVVISCVDDFDMLRKMVPYQINSYLLKSSMSMEEVFGVLEEVKDYLERIGRTVTRDDKKVESLEQKLAHYLLKDGEKPLWIGEQQMREFLFFDLKKEDKNKINELAMKFIYELVLRQIPDGTLVVMEDKTFCLFIPDSINQLDEKVERVKNSIIGFLGVRFQIGRSTRNKHESLRDWYHRYQSEKNTEKPEEEQWNPLIQKAVRYMRNHHNENLNLTDISNLIGLSPSYFSNLFKNETGKNFISFLNEIRLEGVLQELITSNNKISFIAEKHGFNNVEYFTRYFKKNLGVPPGKWRKQHR